MRLSSSVIALALVVAAGCGAPTNLTAVWKSPEVTQPLKFTKVLIVAQSADLTRRRAVETFLVKHIANSTASYQILTPEESKDPAVAKAKVAAGGFDGAVIVRYVGTKDKTTYVPGTTYWGGAPYGLMYGYWGYGWGAAYDPGYLQTDTVVSLESNVYSVPKDTLLWSSQSETISPGSIDALMESVLEATVNAMKKQKVL